MLRFSNFLFPESRDPGRDAEVIADCIEEAKLCDELGVEVLWLAEHHFDGNCAYVDPVTFAAAVLAATKRIKVGFAVAQVSLHHPMRLAEQMSLLDNLGRGRVIVGLGRGTAYNVYEYQGYGIPHEEALERYEEAEGIMLKAWTSPEGFSHEGKHWTLKVPRLRPQPFTQPHPYLIRAASSEAGALHLARRGVPFLMNVQSNETTAKRLALYRAAMAEAGFDAAHIARCLDESWVWRNVVVAETDAEAERIGIPAFEAMQEHRKALRERIYAEQGIIMKKEEVPPARVNPSHALIAGSPATVAAKMAEIESTGVGGVICSFRLGPMPAATAATSIRRFMEEVAPRFAAPAVPAAAE
ncbi:LLM class flavin-dependent oxidoreductase [Neoroseomonas oryzicola]|uniref:LLM class flavin-dependent oxidoreductase n=1 Tax=Neoroseomonas oryzicola TaxID=535904 RepID=A0A9X9WQF7_9PROT|nr:LLM class flavin-dependent oxidoreductase [Neoroseomonas oryzicola]MBR0662567.1 LLM class flavin-dependent oxidoreductase [Neoroseomonas oryzicola]NKE16950.1 LLM class flavin-dependent oxidoreductase [Neoroseomonas oryzicola]